MTVPPHLPLPCDLADSRARSPATRSEAQRARLGAGSAARSEDGSHHVVMLGGAAILATAGAVDG